MPRPLLTAGKNPVPTAQEVGWAPGSVWTGAENLAPTRIRFPDRPARSQLLYRLRYLPSSRGMALPFHDHGTRRGEGSASRRDKKGG